MPKLIVSIDGVVVKEFQLTKDRSTIGRRPYNDVVIDNLAVSGEHAVIQMALKRGGIALLCQLEILSCGRHIAVLPLYTHFVPAAHGGCRRTLYLYIV